MGRREARIARKNEKQIKENEKKARLVEAVSLQQRPRTSFDPDDTKTARAEATPESIMQLPMTFRMFDFADKEGEWSWGQLRNWCLPEARGGAGCVIRSVMTDMSRLTWSEILAETTGGRRKRRKKHHDQSWDSLCQEAQERWLAVERTEEDLFRFRVGGKARIWGVRQGATFFVVWWDAEHQIYPTEKG